MREGLDKVLEAVSRSFYLTIRVLPPVLRQPVGLTYLLARTSDTIADSAAASPEMRLEALRQFGEAICGSGAMPDFTELSSGILDPPERVLLEKAGVLMDCLNATAAEDRAEIERVLGEILRGQELDLKRFACTGTGVHSLATAAELEDYTYSVAGCVGEFWTRICSRHLRDYAPGTDLETLSKLGMSFGKGLQLVNILRDAPADLANGRCYFPAEELESIDPATLRTIPELARPVYERWMARAREHLEDGFHYIEAVRPWRLRLACFLPWALGVETLQRMQRSLPLETTERVKVPRKEVRWLLVYGGLAALGNFGLSRAAAYVRKG